LVRPDVSVDPSKVIVLSSRQARLGENARSAGSHGRKKESEAFARAQSKKIFDERHIEHENNTPIS